MAKRVQRRRCLNKMVIYMYIVPGQGQTTPWEHIVFININVLSICILAASFLKFNYILLILPIQMHRLPKLNLPQNKSRSSNGYDLYNLGRALLPDVLC